MIHSMPKGGGRTRRPLELGGGIPTAAGVVAAAAGELLLAVAPWAGLIRAAALVNHAFAVLVHLAAVLEFLRGAAFMGNPL